MNLRAKAQAVFEILVETYGELPLYDCPDKLKELVLTMLSHRTTKQDELTAFERMWSAYGSWDAIQNSPTDELGKTLMTVRFPEQKARHIQQALQRIYNEQGEYRIAFLKAMSTAEALAWLMSLPGVGIKTATLVLLFCFYRPVLPVDTHVHRISLRVGLVPEQTTADMAHQKLLQLFEPDPLTLYNFHKAMLKHGQTLCTYYDPKCEACPLASICDYVNPPEEKQLRLF